MQFSYEYVAPHSANIETQRNTGPVKKRRGIFSLEGSTACSLSNSFPTLSCCTVPGTTGVEMDVAGPRGWQRYRLNLVVQISFSG